MSELDPKKKYRRMIKGFCGTIVEVDCYRILRAVKTGEPELDHAIKKLCFAGIRGKGSRIQDLKEAIISIQMAIDFEYPIIYTPKFFPISFNQKTNLFGLIPSSKREKTDPILSLDELVVK